MIKLGLLNFSAKEEKTCIYIKLEGLHIQPTKLISVNLQFHIMVAKSILINVRNKLNKSSIMRKSEISRKFSFYLYS